LYELFYKAPYFTAILAVFFITLVFHGVYEVSAQGAPSISGDEVCGGLTSDGKANPCKVSDLKKVVKGILTTVVTLGLPLLVVFIVYRFVVAWFYLRQGNTNAYKEALKKSSQAVLGFLIVIGVFGGIFLIMLKFFTVQDGPLKILNIISMAFIPHAYAATGGMLPNFLGVDNLYDFILLTLRFAMRFFIYPALIIMWVWSGFAFVTAQGNPEGLKKARTWLMWAVITTLVVFMVQGFLIALQGSVKKILPGASVSTESTQTITAGPQTDGRVAPAAGTYGSTCTMNDGTTGTVLPDGSCGAGRGGTANTPSGTGRSSGIGLGGGCRIDIECSGTFTCVSGYCAGVAGQACTTTSGATGMIATGGTSCVAGGAR
jgi:hypothetical protein